MAFVVAALIACTLCLVSLVGLGFVEVESPLGMLRDGLKRGDKAPPWELIDANGVKRGVPSLASWQLLVFADHSLKEFSGLIEGIRGLLVAEPELEAILLHRGNHEITRLTVELLNLLTLPLAVVPTTQRFYERYNVRVMPFVMFLDPQGFSRARGMVNDSGSLFALWRAAMVPLSREPVAPEEE